MFVVRLLSSDADLVMVVDGMLALYQKAKLRPLMRRDAGPLGAFNEATLGTDQPVVEALRDAVPPDWVRGSL